MVYVFVVFVCHPNKFSVMNENVIPNKDYIMFGQWLQAVSQHIDGF